MTRKLFSLLLSAFALFLLMGAGMEESSVPADGAELLPVDTTEITEPSLEAGEELAPPEEIPMEPVPAVEGTNVFELLEETDGALTVDGRPVSAEVSRDQSSGTTYVALGPMAEELDASVSVTWNPESRTVTVSNEKVHLTATVGQQYLVANGRYLYLAEGVQMLEDRVMVPLSALVKAFDGALSWDQTTNQVAVSRGGGGIQPGELFYDESDLFWLSRIIDAESRNQPLEGQMAVGNVILNRVESPLYPNTVEEVLSQKNQFTTYQSGQLASRTPIEKSVIAAKLVMDGGVVEETKSALYFDSSSNSWASRNRPYVATIGGHKFYG